VSGERFIGVSQGCKLRVWKFFKGTSRKSLYGSSFLYHFHRPFNVYPLRTDVLVPKPKSITPQSPRRHQSKDTLNHILSFHALPSLPQFPPSVFPSSLHSQSHPTPNTPHPTPSHPHTLPLSQPQTPLP